MAASDPSTEGTRMRQLPGSPAHAERPAMLSLAPAAAGGDTDVIAAVGPRERSQEIAGPRRPGRCVLY